MGAEDDQHNNSAAGALAVMIIKLEDKEEDNEEKLPWGGLRPGRAPNKERNFETVLQTLKAHYFSGVDSLYNEDDFERHFRMKQHFFNKLYKRIHGCDPFIQKRLHRKKWHSSTVPIRGMFACLHHFAYGNACDCQDEYLQLSKLALSDSVKAFASLVTENFGGQYLNRSLNGDEIKYLFCRMAKHSFPGALAGWDCKHFDWENCPVWLAGQFLNKSQVKFIVMEAIADVDHYF